MPSTIRSFRYADVKGLVRLCQVLNFDIDFKFISSSAVNEPLLLLSADRLNRTNFVQFISDLKQSECERTFKHISNTYLQDIRMTTPLQMYFKEKVLAKQIRTCKLVSDLHVRLDRLIEPRTNDRSIPFSLVFIDSRAKTMLSH